VKFETGATDVSDEAAGQLSNVAQVLERNPDLKIELGAFTDAQGSASKNLELSKQRAQSVRKALSARR
jgi:outer membrane protein OmpA-like peptidoglycan-associated protein